jgi:hypothetical protein
MGAALTASLPVCGGRGTLQGMAKRLKRPRDPGQLAKLIGDIAMDDVVRVVEEWEKSRETAPSK